MRCATLRKTIVLLSVLLLAQAGAPQNPDLERIRDEIAHLRQKLDDVRTQTQTAERELEEVGIELDIRTRELEIARRIESDLEQQQHKIEGDIASLTNRIA